MNDTEKSREELINELFSLRKRIAKFETSEALLRQVREAPACNPNRGR